MLEEEHGEKHPRPAVDRSGGYRGRSFFVSSHRAQRDPNKLITCFSKHEELQTKHHAR